MDNKSTININDKIMNKLFSKLDKNSNLKDFLTSMTKDELNELRKTLQIKGISKLKKDQLVIELEKFIFDDLNSIINEKISNEQIKWIKRILDEKGIHDYEEQTLGMLFECRNLGIVFSGVMEDNRKVVIIPEDLRLPIEECIITNTEKEHKVNNEWICITKALLNYYGVLPIEDIYKMVMKVCNKNIDYYDYIVQALDTKNEFYECDKEEGIVYSFKVEKPFYTLHQQKLRNFSYFEVSDQMAKAIKNKDIPNSEKILNNILTKEYGIEAKKAEQFSEICINKIRNGYSLKEILESLFGFMDFKNMDGVNEFIQKVTFVYNNTRMWYLKGYTVNEAKMKSTGKGKTIVNTIKIGRNDLCPCGSGKKYKKCCGK